MLRDGAPDILRGGGTGWPRCRGCVSLGYEGKADSMENDKEPRRLAAARQAYPPPLRSSRPAVHPSGPPASTGKALASPLMGGSPPPRESGHGKGKPEPRLTCQELECPGPFSLRPRSQV